MFVELGLVMVIHDRENVVGHQAVCVVLYYLECGRVQTIDLENFRLRDRYVF